MDSLTQIVLGAACGEAVAGKKLGNKAMLWGAVGGTIPDLDVLITPLFDHVTALLVHRGYSHSVFFSILVAPILAWMLNRINPSPGYSTWFKLFFWSLFTHPILDAFTGYGTPLFIPFFDYRFDINSIFIIDPIYTLIFIVCLIKVMRAGKNQELRSTWNWRGIRWSSVYLVFTLLNQQLHLNVFERDLEKNKISYSSAFAAPTAFNQVLFYNFTVTDSGYYHGYHSWFDSKPVDFTFYPKNDDLLPLKLHTHPLIEKLKYFSKGYYCFEQINNELYFCDVRFGKINGFSGEDSPWVFRWKLSLVNDSLIITKGNWSMSRFKAINDLFDRIKGN